MHSCATLRGSLARRIAEGFSIFAGADMIQADAIIIAKGAPNQCRDGRKVMCAIGVSESLGLIRLYPLSVTNDGDISIWSIVRLSLSISNTDNRRESYRVGSYEVIGKMESPHEKHGLLESCILQSGAQDPIDYQNERRKSIAVVKSLGPVGASLTPREAAGGSRDTDGDDGFVMTQADFPFKPYVQWTSEQGKPHTTHLVGQEVYMGMARNQSTPFRIFENLRIGDRDYDHWLVLGNMKDRRNVWVAAHLHRQKKIVQRPMFTSLWITDGTSEGWPYETQEATDARFAEKCPLLNFTT
jgi:hypothetical protein